MHKIFDNMLTNEWKTFSRGRKEGRDFKRKEEKKEGRDGVRQACPTMTYPTV